MEVWQLSISLATDIYKLTDLDKFRKDYSLKDQMRRCAVSIPSNIAEGFNRNSKKDFIKFLHYSKASTAELYTQLTIAKNINYIGIDQFKSINEAIQIISKSIGGLIKAISTYVY